MIRAIAETLEARVAGRELLDLREMAGLARALRCIEEHGTGASAILDDIAADGWPDPYCTVVRTGRRRLQLATINGATVL